MNLNEKEFKTAAKNLKAEVAKLGIELSHGAALNLLSRTLGFYDYNTAVPELKKYEGTLATPESEAQKELEALLEKLSSSLLDFYRLDFYRVEPSLKKIKEIKSYAQKATRLYRELNEPLCNTSCALKASITDAIVNIVYSNSKLKEVDFENEDRFFDYICKELFKFPKQFLVMRAQEQKEILAQ